MLKKSNKLPLYMWDNILRIRPYLRSSTMMWLLRRMRIAESYGTSGFFIFNSIYVAKFGIQNKTNKNVA